MLLQWPGIWRESLIRTSESSMFDYMFFIPETVECKGWTTRLPQSPTWKCKEHCKSWNEPKDRAKVTPCLSETMQVNKSRSMRKWWSCLAACSNCVHCIYIKWKLAQILTIPLRKYVPVHKQDHERWRYIPVKTVITVKFSLNGENHLMSWNSVEILKFSHNCEIQLKLRNSFETAKFSWNCDIQLKLRNSVEIVKFSRNCEIQ